MPNYKVFSILYDLTNCAKFSLDKCEFEQTMYEIEEGEEDNIYLTFLKPLSEDVEIRLKYVDVETSSKLCNEIAHKRKVKLRDIVISQKVNT